MKNFKGIQVLLLGIILITCSGCNLLSWGDSGNTSEGVGLSGSVQVRIPEAQGPVYVIPEGPLQVEERDNSNPVPEPMTLLLLGPALLGLYAMNKKKKNA